MIKLLNGIIEDSVYTQGLANKHIRFVFERTGTKNTHQHDRGLHLDTQEIYWDDSGKRVGYSKHRSPEVYMVYVGRPGSLVVHGRVSDAISFHDSISLGKEYTLDIENSFVLRKGSVTPLETSRLPANSIYKVAVGDLFHCPLPHADGLLITARFSS